MIDWDGTSVLTTETIVGAYGARAKFVGPAKDKGVIVVQFLETSVPMFVEASKLVRPPKESDTEIEKLAVKIMATDTTISSEAATALAKLLYEPSQAEK